MSGKQRRADIPVTRMAGWKTRLPVIEAEARETDKALKVIVENLGV